MKVFTRLFFVIFICSLAISCKEKKLEKYCPEESSFQRYIKESIDEHANLYIVIQEFSKTNQLLKDQLEAHVENKQSPPFTKATCTEKILSYEKSIRDINIKRNRLIELGLNHLKGEELKSFKKKFFEIFPVPKQSNSLDDIVDQD
ncbi:MAG: hypothetical protein ACJAU8_000024 [Candidatus Paceibacteria bacterium]|jgi:hypothetical protein